MFRTIFAILALALIPSAALAQTVVTNATATNRTIAYDGGPTKTLDLSNLTTCGYSILVDLAASKPSFQCGGLSHKLTNVENVIGPKSKTPSFTVYGGPEANRFTTTNGKGFLSGGGGSDVLIADGASMMTGGAGADTFVQTSKPAPKQARTRLRDFDAQAGDTLVAGY